jgi:ABC-type branched-subunit amino acid transport system ATPase component
MTVDDRATSEVAGLDLSHRAALRVEHLTVRYGQAVEAVHDLTFTVEPGEIVALLGANGAGKSTVLNAISGLTATSAGSISVGETELGDLRAQQRAHHVAHVPEGRQLFPTHTVSENMALGAFATTRIERRRRLARCLAVLPRLSRLSGRPAGLLSGGEQQMVALGRGLMSEAPVLMIDELSLGLAPAITNSFADTLLELRAAGYAILLVEQYLTLALRVADRVLVLDRGRVVLEGRTEDIREQVTALEDAYLGGGGHEAPVADVRVPTARAEEAVVPAQAPVAIGGALVALIATLFPWFRIEAFNHPTVVKHGWDLGAAWPPFILAPAVVLVALGAWRVIRSRPLPVPAGIACVLVAATSLAATMSRCWLLQEGLGAPAGSTVKRVWGMLVALYALVIATVGAVSILRESLNSRRATEVRQ